MKGIRLPAMLIHVFILVGDTGDYPNIRMKLSVEMEPSILTALYQSRSTCLDLTWLLRKVGLDLTLIVVTLPESTQLKTSPSLFSKGNWGHLYVQYVLLYFFLSGIQHVDSFVNLSGHFDLGSGLYMALYSLRTWLTFVQSSYKDRSTRCM